MAEKNSTLASNTRAFTTDQVCQLTGMSYRRVDYIVTSRLIDHRDPKPGSGKSRSFTLDQLVLLKAIADSTDAGLTLKAAVELAVYGTIANRFTTVTIDVPAVRTNLLEVLDEHARH